MDKLLLSFFEKKIIKGNLLKGKIRWWKIKFKKGFRRKRENFLPHFPGGKVKKDKNGPKIVNWNFYYATHGKWSCRKDDFYIGESEHGVRGLYFCGEKIP